MFIARLLVFFGVLVGAVGIGGPVQFILRRFGAVDLAGNLQRATARSLCWALRLHVRVEGALPPRRPALVIANHVSWTDIIALASIAPVSFVAKSDVAGWPLIGAAIRAHGTLFVSRQRSKSMPRVNTQMADALAAGRPVVLFPEATTGNGTRLEPFHSGHFAAASELLRTAPDISTVSLVPLALAYTRGGGLRLDTRDRAAVAWFGDMPLLPHVVFLLRKGPTVCEMIWGEPLPFRRGDDRKSAAAALRRQIHRNFTRLVGGIVRGEVDPVQRATTAVWSAQIMPTTRSASLAAPTAAPSAPPPGPAS